MKTNPIVWPLVVFARRTDQYTFVYPRALPARIIDPSSDRLSPVFCSVGAHNTIRGGHIRPSPGLFAMFRNPTTGLVETGSKVVTYFDRLTDAPPHGVVRQRSGLQTAVTPQFCFFPSRIVIVFTQRTHQTTRLSREANLIYQIHEARGRYKKVQSHYRRARKVLCGGCWHPTGFTDGGCDQLPRIRGTVWRYGGLGETCSQQPFGSFTGELHSQ